MAGSVTKSWESKFKKRGTQAIEGSISTLQLVDKYGPIAQQAVAKKLDITVPAAFFHCQKLRLEGLIKSVKPIHPNNNKGRPSALWDIDRANNFTIGLTIVPPMLLVGLADFNGKIVIQHQHDLSNVDAQEELLNVIDTFVLSAKEYVSRTSGSIRSVFAGMPGYLEHSSGAVFFSANMPVIVGLNIEEYMQEKHELFCRSLTHYYSTYFGEKEFFPPDTTLSVVDWELGLGHVAGCNDEIYSIAGRNGLISKGIRDIGHMRVVRDGRKCHCGRKGCLEAYVGGWAILQQLNRPDIRKLSDIVAFAHRGDQQVLDELNKAVKFLGTQMTWIIRFLGTDRIIITGPLSEVFPLVSDAFCEGLKQDLTDEEVTAINPVASVNPADRMLSGACRLGKHVFLHPEAYLKQRGDFANTASDGIQPKSHEIIV
jgi:N-acetylglucosamine repressor